MKIVSFNIDIYVRKKDTEKAKLLALDIDNY